MDENGMNQVVGHKRIREQAEEDEEEFMILFMGVLLVLIGSQYRRKQSLECSSSASGFREERIYARGVFLRAFEIQSVCLGQLRMPTRVFDKLCSILCEDGGLVPTRNVTIGEMVTIFLYILGHGFKNSNVKEILARSGETISRQFHSVLLAVLKIGNKFIKQDYTSSEGSDSSKWKWFKGVVGALDGTHVPLTVPSDDKGRYRNRKGYLSTNVLAACDSYLRFTYVLPGWEGSASDSRVLRDALQRPNGLKLPKNKYFLVDAGYTNGPGFLAPYRGTHYHLQLWKGNTPTNSKEIFNLRHSSARNDIERAFGLLKKRWAILHAPSFYSVKSQIRIINACCILHNFLRNEVVLDSMLNEVDEELENAPISESESNIENITSVNLTPEWTLFRDTLATKMFADFQRRRRHM